MAATVPELKKKIAEQEECEEAMKTELGEVKKQMLNMKIKHLEERHEIEEQNVKLTKEKHIMEELMPNCW